MVRRVCPLTKGSALGLFFGSSFFSRRFFCSRSWFSRSFFSGSFFGWSFFSWSGFRCGFFSWSFFWCSFFSRRVSSYFFNSRFFSWCSLGFFQGSLRSFIGRCSFFSFFFSAFHGLFARLSLVRVVARSTFENTSCVEETGNPVTRLAANAEPVTGAVFVQGHALFIVLGKQRVVGADLLKVFAITRRALVSRHDPVVRTFLGTAAGKTECNCHNILPFEYKYL